MAAASTKPDVIRLADYRPPAYLVDHIDLDFDLTPERTEVTARLTVRANPDVTAPGDLVLDGDELELLSLAVDGAVRPPDSYTLTAETLTIPDVPDAFELETRVAVKPDRNTKLEGLYISNGTFCTQCEAEGFRRITFYPDRPDILATYTTTIRADRSRFPVLLSNGNRTAHDDLPDGRHQAVWHDPFPKPSYLFALVAGDLACVEDHFTTASGRDVTLRIFVEHGNEAKCGYAMDSLKRSMRWDEEKYGREYDLDVFNIVAVSDFNMGAMENKSLNVFNAKYVLADPDTATDADYAAIEAIVAHEYFHNWTGNRITCRDWFQLSLKEGLTVFRDQSFSADMRSAAVKRIQDVRSLRARQFPEDAGPLAHPVRPDSYVEINNFYTATVYEKGAEVIAMLHTLLGEDGYRKGMDLYFARHDGEAVTCDDFVQAMADANDRDLGQFKRWYHQAGTPRVRAMGRYDAAARAYTLELEQWCPATPGQDSKAPYLMPIRVGLLGADGAPIPAGGDGSSVGGAPDGSVVLSLSEPAQTFRFDNVATKPVVSINRGFSAPVIVESGQGTRDLAFLMAHDRDPFNRWEAGQRYATQILLSAVNRLQNGDLPIDEPEFIAALDKTLTNPDLDKAFIALAVALPSESFLADQMAVVDPDNIHAAREWLRQRIATELGDTLRATYRANFSNQPYSPDAEQAGERALKNAALGYLVKSDGGAGTALAAEQYAAASNMTDRMAALSLLADLDVPARTQALDDFHARYRSDPLVLDKWLSLQAMSSLPGTLATVIALTSHPAFSLKNPNKVRALIGAFASGNQVRFHADDGSGYTFLADQILALDAINPQVAARLTSPLGQWRRQDENRSRRMRKELARILDRDGLSKDVYEIASKSLD